MLPMFLIAVAVKVMVSTIYYIGSICYYGAY